MSKACLDTKCFNLSTCWKGHLDPPLHFIATSPDALSIGSFSGQGQVEGKEKTVLLDDLFSGIEETICGMTSPALCTRTWSPSLISFLLISSSLCNVALDTNTPPILIGSSSATGVKIPVRPTWIVIFFNLVCAFSEGNFLAIAHLGAFATEPSLVWKSILLTYRLRRPYQRELRNGWS